MARQVWERWGVIWNDRLMCPYCGGKWMFTRARKSLLKLYGQFEIECKCGRSWRVQKHSRGYQYFLI